MAARSKTIDRLVGIFILLPLILIAALVAGLAMQKGWFEHWIIIKAPFPKETTVPVNAKVTFAGVEVGSVRSVSPDIQTPDCIIAKLMVRSSRARGIKEDSTASLVRPFILIGDPIVNISFGSEDGPQVVDGGRIAMKKRAPDEPEELSVDTLRVLLTNANKLTKKADVLLDQVSQPNSPAQRILANSDKLLTDLVAAEEKLAVLLRDEKAFTKEVNDRIAAGLVQIMNTMREQHAAVPISHEGGELQMRLNPKLQGQVDQLIAMAEKLDKMFDQLTKTDNTLSLLMRNREFYDRTLDLVADARAMMSDMRELMANLRKISPDLGALVSSGRTMMDRGSRLLEGLESNPFLGTPAPVPRPGPPTDVEQRFTGPEPGAAKPAPPPTGRK